MSIHRLQKKECQVRCVRVELDIQSLSAHMYNRIQDTQRELTIAVTSLFLVFLILKPMPITWGPVIFHRINYWMSRFPSPLTEKMEILDGIILLEYHHISFFTINYIGRRCSQRESSLSSQDWVWLIWWKAATITVSHMSFCSVSFCSFSSLAPKLSYIIAK